MPKGISSFEKNANKIGLQPYIVISCFGPTIQAWGIILKNNLTNKTAIHVI